MKRWAKRLALVLALAFLGMSVLNASWLAPAPRGYVKLIAQRGTMQQFSHKDLGPRDCTATRIEPPVHDYLENTLPGLSQAARLGAQAIAVTVAPTADGQIVLFHDWTLNCRTDGKGEVRKATLAQSKALDAGYGYSADGGKTFPLRGTGRGAIPTLREALALLPEKPLIYTLKSRDPREADLLIAALNAAGRKVEQIGDGFVTDAALLPRLRRAYPNAWAFSPQGVKACTKDYLVQGWLGLTPESCRNGTLFVPLNYQWAFAGWPNRTIARMQAVGARIVITGDRGKGLPMGLDLPEQLGKVPAGFNGYLLVDDIYTIGPALRPAYNRRRPPEEAALARALEARRAARD